MTPDERAVLAANDVFYAAFTAQDGAAMDAVWSRECPVSCIHPGWAPLRDRALILKSWRAIFRGPRPPAVTIDDARAIVVGPAAWVVCYERLTNLQGEEAGTLVATNVFVRESGEWRLAHHHAGPVATADDEDEDEDEDPDPSGEMLN